MSLASALMLSQQGSGAGLSTALIAGLFTLLGAAITLGFQVISGHNVNRRDDRKQAIDAVADLTASAWLLVQEVASRQPSPSSSVSTNDQKSKTHTEALSTFHAAYARLILVAPAARPAINSLRGYITGGTMSAADDPRAKIDRFIEDVRPKLRSPVFAFLRTR